MREQLPQLRYGIRFTDDSSRLFMVVPRRMNSRIRSDNREFFALGTRAQNNILKAFHHEHVSAYEAQTQALGTMEPAAKGRAATFILRIFSAANILTESDHLDPRLQFKIRGMQGKLALHASLARPALVDNAVQGLTRGVMSDIASDMRLLNRPTATTPRHGEPEIMDLKVAYDRRGGARLSLAVEPEPNSHALPQVSTADAGGPFGTTFDTPEAFMEVGSSFIDPAQMLVLTAGVVALSHADILNRERLLRSAER